MEEKFREIKEEYDNLQKDMLRQGKLPLRDTGIGFWGGAAIDEVFEAFKRIKLHNFRNFIDIGSGDGRVVLIASLFGVRAVGIEVDNELFRTSLQIQRKLNIPNAVFYNNDFFDHSFAGHDILFCNPDQPMERGLEKKLLKEMNGKLIVYGYHFHPRNLKKEQSFILNGTLITVYGKE
jgi:hypothetical protein